MSSKLLADQVLEEIEKSNFPPGPPREYVPEGVLDKLITRNSLCQEFSENSALGREHHVDEDLLNFILGSAKKVLAISLLAGVESKELHDAMKEFKSSLFQDNWLPIYSTDEKKLPWSNLSWSSVKRKHFLDNQWKFLAPIFRKNQLMYEFESLQVFPSKFTTDTKQKIGGFGAVYEVTIHESHLEEPIRKFDETRANVAIKSIKASEGQLDNGDDQAWEREATALQETADLKHPHLIECKAIIDWKGTGKYFMFQWADGGNLRDFYNSEQRPELNASFVKQIVIQLVGLADALNKMHNYKRHNRDAGSYRHGDVKPENILIFKNRTKTGFWRIADMGLAKHHFDATGLRGPTATRNGTPLYEPPEVILKSDQARSRQYDIWSMGCVILELIVWLLYGTEELEKFNNCLHDSFRNKSPYWAVKANDAKDAQVHPHVQTCMKNIKKHPECTGSTAIGDLLEIMTTMLTGISQ
ncbi:Serine/threonine-protein kinase DCLK3 [Cytospora mali]|uniref:Serine/threonine-protein kinase DCLK3 n=1 Tax=Cytospora mali TaxID=578113 RepID=A0A194VZZ9_CYTMA|nr:Serine/threonine-protein kinase DCLK3 [Valsa mali]